MTAMASAVFRYLSPSSIATMLSLDNTIISVHEDDSDSPTMPAAEPVIADAKATNSNQRTKNQFRPRVGKGGATSYQLRQYAEVTLGGGSLRKVVKLPEGEDENEWLAVNSGLSRLRQDWIIVSVLTVAVVDFYNQINLLYGAITEFCSPHSCPEMKATDEYGPPNGTLRSGKVLTFQI
ncbi:putative maintenance of ploidy protein mob1 [Metarhizium anisopliae]|nr:putative maintenance of ploidy protein mob1 [Metarhizium anisopliae]